MKTTEQVWEEVDGYTKVVSEQSRKLAYAATAICWFFREGEPGIVSFPTTIVVALFFVVLFFASDLGQYLVHSAKLTNFTYKEEDRFEKETGSNSGPIAIPTDLLKWGDRLFNLKLFCLFATFVSLLVEFANQLV